MQRKFPLYRNTPHFVTAFSQLFLIIFYRGPATSLGTSHALACLARSNTRRRATCSVRRARRRRRRRRHLVARSRELRRRIASGGMYRYYVAPEVYDYIQTNQLYR